MPKLDDYAPIVGQGEIDELRGIAAQLRGRRFLHVNSTAVGGGVAEILNRMVPLLGELGLDARWEVIKGGEKFFAVTKKFHNAMHGRTEAISESDYQAYLETVEENAARMDLASDYVLIHDPQPASLVAARAKAGGRWIWRCHIDLSHVDESVWNFFKPIIERYNACIFSAPSFSQALSIPQILIPPSIDPLSEKNMELSPEFVEKVSERFGLDRTRPIVTQVSRFDYLKDPLGVIDAYRMVKPYVDCQLVLAGGTASDDPEGGKVLSEVQQKAGDDPDIHVLALPPTSHTEINALQRASTVLLQKSIREGFGLTVSEALWKGKPVIAGAVGGIPLQITHKYSGILTRSTEGTAYWLKQLLQSPEYARKLGENGREHVRNNFLLLRHLKDYLLLLLATDHPGENVVYL